MSDWHVGGDWAANGDWLVSGEGVVLHTTDAIVWIDTFTVAHTADAILHAYALVGGTITILPTVTGTLTLIADPGLVNEGPPGSNAGANTGGGGGGAGGGDGLPQQGGTAGGSAVGRNLFGLRNYRKPITIIKRNDAS